MKPLVRKSLLGGALLLTIVAVILVRRAPQQLTLAEPVVKPSKRESRDRPAGEAPTLAKLARPTMDISDSNPFAPKSWYAPPPPPPVQDIKPTAPPLPFVFRGKLGEDEERQLFYLAKGEESFVVAVGDTFAGSYKLESAREGALVFRYIPLSLTQTLRYGPNL